MRIGHGYDVHRFAEGRKLILGGVTVDSPVGLDGHSDADVLVHALMDALLGAVGAGDIGMHFPDTDMRYKDISSMRLLERVCAIVAEKGYRVGNVDMTIIAQKPKLMPYIPQMREKIAAQLSVDTNCVNIKATTEEGLGFTGAMEGMACHAVCLLEERK